MELWLKLNSQENKLTKSDDMIRKYIIDNVYKIPYMSVRELGDATNTSDSAITRFCRKIQLKGYNDLKMGLSKIIPTLEKERFKFNAQISRYDTMESIFEKVTNSSVKALMQSKNLIDTQTLQHAATAIDALEKKAGTLYIIATGNAQIVAVDAVFKFRKIGVRTAFSNEYHLQLLDCVYMTQNDVVLAISTSGKTREIFELLKLAKEKKAKTISISQSGNVPTDQFTDIKITMPYIESELRESSIASRIVQLNIIDTLFISIMSKRFEYVQQGLEDARRFVEHTKIKL